MLAVMQPSKSKYAKTLSQRMLRLVRIGHTNAFYFSLLRRARHQSGATHVAFRTSADAISPPVAMNNLVRFCMTLKSQFSADIPEMT